MTQTLDEATGSSEELSYPMDRAPGCPFDPPPTLKRLQEEEPVTPIQFWDGADGWLVTNHEYLLSLLGDSRVSNDYAREGFPHANAAMKTRFTHHRTFFNMDAPEHPRRRRMVAPPFAVKRMEAMRPKIQQMTDDLIDRMLAGPRPVDLVDAFALPLPSMLISELLGVPYDHAEFFQEASLTLVRRTSTPEQIVSAIDQLSALMEELLDQKRSEPSDDLLTELVTRRVDTGELTQREAAEMAVLILFAGHETTANMIALGTAALLQHPDQVAALQTGDDPKLFASAAEEMLRYLTITHWGRRRVALEDIEIGGQIIRAGQGIVCSAEIANRDPQVFDDPDTLDLRRDARRHVAFGYGTHQCLGQSLARVELQVVYGTLFRRIPTLQLAVPVDELPFKTDAVIYGLYELPVTWA